MEIYLESILRRAVLDCLSHHFSSFHLISTDTSKDDNKISIAAMDLTKVVAWAYLVYHLNLVFTVVIFALQLGVEMAPGGGNSLFLTDSMSALHALH